MTNLVPRSLFDEAGFVNKRSGYEIMKSQDKRFLNRKRSNIRSKNGRNSIKPNLLLGQSEVTPQARSCHNATYWHLLQCAYSNQGTWKKIIQSQGFLNKRFSGVFYANGPIKFKVNYATVETTNLTSHSGNSPQIYGLRIILARLQKNLRIFSF